jgi:DNA-binding transcriptional LysR family regulator
VSDIKLKDLRYLVAVADARHFGRAAGKCFVSQPTLSAQLKKLEQYLGVQLIERAPQNIKLTEAGEQIVARARRILEDSDAVVTLAHAHRDPLAGVLRIALLPTIGPYLLPRVSQLVRKALPRLELRLYEYQTAQMLEKLQLGEIDLGVLALPVDTEGLESRELYSEPFIVAPSARPCASRICRVSPCCCWKMDTVCAIRHWKCAVASGRMRNRISGQRAWKRCGRWSPRARASPSCRSLRHAARMDMPKAWQSVPLPAPPPSGTLARCGVSRLRGCKPFKRCAK